MALFSAVWLRTGNAEYLATTSTRVLSDGFIARPLNVERTSDFVTTLSSELPDISARLVARGSGVQLPEATDPSPPSPVRRWDTSSYSTDVLITSASRPTTKHHVACGLLLESRDRRLLVATDPATPSMVLSEDPELIARYVAQCERIAVKDYLETLA